MGFLKVKFIWKTLLVLSLGCLVWVAGLFARDLRNYFRLAEVAPVEILNWEMEQIKPERYVVSAHYEFEKEGEPIEGHYRFLKTPFPNTSACVQAAEKLKAKSWWIYYDPKLPERAALQKLFPIKGAVHLLLSLAVVFYFVWFRGYIWSLLPDE